MSAGYLDHPRPLAFAHRGGAGDFPENSWKAFEHAVGLGYAYLETDAHATADGTVVAFHDRTLDRVTDRTGRIAELTAADVAAARIGGTEPIPLLADLVMAWPDVRFNIDVKDEPVIMPLVEVLRATDCWERVCLTSFSGSRLNATRQLLPRPVCSATSPAGIGAIRAGLPVKTLTARFAAKAVRCAQIPYSMATSRFLERAHSAGLQVHAWTVNDPVVMARLLDLGVDGIMTDQTAVLRDLLIARGQWHPRIVG
ncbi:MAG TPA: glycerophosphodiester phosphodiesterase [Streptosporangiaceae bacterium]|nr:glycerophosphodiester phosphodiesterase [Streptosporangiaceae bacterium]